jgi:hypothetical protein
MKIEFRDLLLGLDKIMNKSRQRMEKMVAMMFGEWFWEMSELMSEHQREGA